MVPTVTVWSGLLAGYIGVAEYALSRPSDEVLAVTQLAMSDRVTQQLQKIAAEWEASLEVGFLEGATYPNGTPVAAVAFWNEFGSSGPPRPFFRNMIAKESPEWPAKIAMLARTSGKDAEGVLRLMGEDIQGALIQSINEFTTPPLAASTIKRKGFDKPLIDHAIMLNSTGYRVIK